MANPENETIFIWNDAERKDGYISFWTSKRSDWERLCRRVGEQNLREVSKTYQNDAIVGCKCNIPTQYTRLASFGLKKVKFGGVENV